jgi:hypothetical protein
MSNKNRATNVIRKPWNGFLIQCFINQRLRLSMLAGNIVVHMMPTLHGTLHTKCIHNKYILHIFEPGMNRFSTPLVIVTV